MKHQDKIPHSPASDQEAQKSDKRRERIVNSEEQNDTANVDGQHYDKHFESEDPQEKAPGNDPAEENDEQVIPKMNAEKVNSQ